MTTHDNRDTVGNEIDLAELLRRHAEAVGGADALAGIETLECVGTLTVQMAGSGPNAAPTLTSTGTSRRVVLPSKSIYACDQWGVTRDEWGWNGEIAWRRNSQDRLRRLHGNDEAFVKLESALAPLAVIHETSPEFLRREPDEYVEAIDETCFVVGVYAADGQLNTKSFIAREQSAMAYLTVARTIEQGHPFVGPGPMRIRILDDEIVAGVRVPRFLRAESDFVSVEWDYTDFTVNEAVDATLFEPPEPTIQYTRSYRKLIPKFLEQKLTAEEFGNRFGELFKWEPTGFPSPAYAALEDLSTSLEEFQNAKNSGVRRDQLLERLMESARTARDILEHSDE